MDSDEDRRWADLPNPALKVQLISSTAIWCHCFSARGGSGMLAAATVLAVVGTESAPSSSLHAFTTPAQQRQRSSGETNTPKTHLAPAPPLPASPACSAAPETNNRPSAAPWTSIHALPRAWCAAVGARASPLASTHCASPQVHSRQQAQQQSQKPWSAWHKQKQSTSPSDPSP